MDPIQAEYERDGDDWKIKVSSGEKSLTGQAPGLIAARDKADQLVQKLVPDVEHPTVVHLLNGDALEFTTAYLNARLAPPEKPSSSGSSPAKKKTKEADKAKEAQPAPPA